MGYYDTGYDYGWLNEERKKHVEGHGSQVDVERDRVVIATGYGMRGATTTEASTSAGDEQITALVALTVDALHGDVIRFKAGPYKGLALTVFKLHEHSIDSQSSPGCRVEVSG